ncbi:MAG: hypothetical protein HRT88_21735, partial [Lentisphaeraceae bacterium]|nr:hypothetical protein [Lentisphaeraceae bacterium]
DENANGIDDWVEKSVAMQGTLDAVPAYSYTSPLCIEGTSQYSSLMKLKVNGLPGQLSDAITGRWFSNIDLLADGQTPIAVSFQSEGLTVPASTEWKALNILDATAPRELQIRVGDTVKFTGQSATIADGTLLTFTVGSARKPLAAGTSTFHKFDTAGEFTVSLASASVKVKVIGFDFGRDTVPVMVGKVHNISPTGMSEGITLETDESLKVASEVEYFSLLASKTNKKHAVIARTSTGAIIDVLTVQPFWVQAATDNLFWVVERHEDYDIWQNTTIVKNLPENVFLKISVIKAGVTLDDLSLVRVIGPAELNDMGEYTFRLIRPKTAIGSTCHNIKAYDGHPDQGGVFLGDAYYGGTALGDVEE